jgi:hypothetical protein
VILWELYLVGLENYLINAQTVFVTLWAMHKNIGDNEAQLDW